MTNPDREKHEAEVLFLEAATGLNLVILQAKEVLQQQESSQFPGLSVPEPVEPKAPIEPVDPFDGGKKDKDKVVRYKTIDVEKSGFGFNKEIRFNTAAGYYEKNGDGTLRYSYLSGGYGGYESNFHDGDSLLDYHLMTSDFPTPIREFHIRQHNKKHHRLWQNKVEALRAEYQEGLAAYQLQALHYPYQMAEYQESLKAYRQQFETSLKSFQDIRSKNSNYLSAVLNEASKKLKSLFDTTRMLPKPYQYPEAVFYLYDFLSTSSDEYDIKYALGRVDVNEMKQMMAAIIQNQRKQAFLLGTILMSIAERLEQVGAVDAGLLPDSEASLQDSQYFLCDNADITERLKPLPRS
jgi:hypothetical protein